MAELDIKLPVGRMILGYAIVVALLLGVAAATHLVPAGEYAREQRVVAETGETLLVVAPDSFRYVEQSPQGISAILFAPIKSLYFDGPIGTVIVVFILLIGGAFTAMRRTGALDAGILHVIRKLEGREHLIIPLTMLFFSLFGALFGILEELLPFVIIIVPLSIALGYDAIVGLMMVFGACAVGFAAAMTNPFTVVVAQSIAELPLFSGFLFRLVVWALMLAITVSYTAWYARRVHVDPSKSLVAGYDADLRKDLERIRTQHAGYTEKHHRVFKTIGLLLLVLLIVMIGGQIVRPKLLQAIGFPLVMLTFVVMGISSGLLGGLGTGGTFRAFGKGIATFLPAALFVMVARAVVVIAADGRIIDTLLFRLSSLVGEYHAVYASWGMLVAQTCINFLIPSGSAQAVIAMPVMIPLGEIVGITRQTSILAFQMGDGFSNMLWPTNPLLIVAVSLAGIPWTRWARFMIPLQIILFIVGCLVLSAAVLMHWGAALEMTG